MIKVAPVECLFVENNNAQYLDRKIVIFFI